MKTLYFSIPVTLDWDTASKAIDQLKGKYNLTYWKREQRYQNGLIEKCDAFVVFFPDNKWKYEVDGLPSGVQREVRRAISLNIPIYLAYIPGSHMNDCKFYRTNAMEDSGFDEDEEYLTGMPGTSMQLYTDIPSVERVVVYNEYPVVNTGTLKIFPVQKKDAYDNSLSDQRLLLLL